MARISLPTAFTLTATAVAFAQPGDGLDFVTISSPGNRAATPEECHFSEFTPLGAVDHSYRMTRTEVTVSQWVDFVRAYAPHKSGAPDDTDFTSIWINYSPGQGYSYNPAYANSPVDISWAYAARFCNWLESGKSNQAGAFESGVYDTSTFKINPDGTPNYTFSHAPGAKYWLPTFDEWIKAVYYDPNRHGTGQEGYWKYTNKSDGPPIPGLPGTEATTNAGVPGGISWFMPVGQYTNAPSPWGLLDTSGGLTEWTSTPYDAANQSVFVHGSFASSDQYVIQDELYAAGYKSVDPRISLGIRLASAIPSVPTCTTLALWCVLMTRRKNR